MHLMYVDESGDCGMSASSPTRYFVLSGLVVHELRWETYLNQLIDFRQRLKGLFGLRLREELHAARMISRPGAFVRIPRNDRLAMIRMFANEIATMGDISLINVVVDKRGKPEGYDAFDMAWKALVQRFENTLSHRNFPGPANPDERGMLFPDHTDDKKLMILLRKMRRYNPVPSRPEYGMGYRNLPLGKIIEDPNFRRSDHSYFIQAVDLVAFLLYQQEAPSAYMKKKSAHNYFKKLSPVFCRVASPGDPQGVVRL